MRESFSPLVIEFKLDELQLLIEALKDCHSSKAKDLLRVLGGRLMAYQMMGHTDRSAAPLNRSRVRLRPHVNSPASYAYFNLLSADAQVVSSELPPRDMIYDRAVLQLPPLLCRQLVLTMTPEHTADSQSINLLYEMFKSGESIQVEFEQYAATYTGIYIATNIETTVADYSPLHLIKLTLRQH